MGHIQKSPLLPPELFRPIASVSHPQQARNIKCSSKLFSKLITKNDIELSDLSHKFKQRGPILALKWAAENGKPFSFSRLLPLCEFDPCSLERIFHLVLHTAAVLGHAQIASFMISAGPSINRHAYICALTETAKVAFENDQAEVYSVLVKAGAMVFLSHAASLGLSDEVASCLKGGWGETSIRRALKKAALKGHGAVTKLLLDHLKGNGSNAQEDLYTTLGWACVGGRFEVIFYPTN